MLSIVIPVFNERENLPELYERLTLAGQTWGDTFEILLVDDGSADDSARWIRETAERDERVRMVRLSRNFGHQAAISAGLRFTRGDAVVVMDGDLQDQPEEISRLLDTWKQGNEVVYAIRTSRKEPWAKRFAYRTFYRILRRVSHLSIPLDAGDFCVMDRKVVDVLNDQLPEYNRFVRGLRAFAGFKQVGIPCERAERASGKPKYTVAKLLGLALDGILDFSALPLRLAMYIGLSISVVSFLSGLFFIVHRVLDFQLFGYSPTDTPGLATLAVGGFFLGGIVLVMLGIIGEYLGRIYAEVKGRPSYVVETVYPTPVLNRRPTGRPPNQRPPRG